MKPVAIPPADYGLRFPVQVGPRAGGVSGHSIRDAGRRVRDPTTLHLYPDRIRIATAGDRFQATHPRSPTPGTTSYLAGQRSEQLATVAGARKRLYFMRERILELGPIGEAYLTELIRSRQITRKGDVERLFMLLEEVGEARFGQLFQRSYRSDRLRAMLKRLHLPTVWRLYPSWRSGPNRRAHHSRKTPRDHARRRQRLEISGDISWRTRIWHSRSSVEGHGPASHARGGAVFVTAHEDGAEIPERHDGDPVRWTAPRHGRRRHLPLHRRSITTRIFNSAPSTAFRVPVAWREGPSISGTDRSRQRTPPSRPKLGALHSTPCGTR